VGYYRTQYEPETLKNLNAAVMNQLTTAERMSLLSDEAALMKAGQENVAGFLDLVTALNQDAEASIVESYRPSLDSINSYLVTPADRDSFHAWLRATLRPMMAKIGWMPSASETDDTHTLRSDLVEILGGLAEDRETIRE